VALLVESFVLDRLRAANRGPATTLGREPSNPILHELRTAPQ